MKKRILCLCLTIFLILLTACNNEEVKNPVRSEVINSSSESDTNNAESSQPEESEQQNVNNKIEEDNSSFFEDFISDYNSSDESVEDYNSETNNVDSPNISTSSQRRKDRITNKFEDEDSETEEVIAPSNAPIKEWIEGTGGKYKLVWSDEFDKKGIDYNKWCYGSENGTNLEKTVFLTEKEDPSIITAEDGMLKMHTRRYISENDPQVEYATNRSFSTRETMNFKYGFVEMRAMVPVRHGTFSALWSIGKPALVQRKHPYYVEVDFFECFSSSNQIIPNFHKWYDDYSHSNFDLAVSQKLGTDIGKTKYGTYFFDAGAQPYKEFHLYQFEWTKEYMKFFVDGKCYCTFDITMAYDADWEYSNSTNAHLKLDKTNRKDMTGFHEYIYLLLQNLIYVSSNDASQVVTKDDKFPYCYYVDYLRVYQDPTNKDSGLVYLNEKGERTDYYANK